MPAAFTRVRTGGQDRTLNWLAGGLSTAAAICLAGAFLLPFVEARFALRLPPWVPQFLATEIRTWLVAQGKLPVGEFSLSRMIEELFLANEYLLGMAIVLFSIVIPILKIACCASLAFDTPALSDCRRQHTVRVLTAAGKWSMADVFIVGMVVVFFKAEGFSYEFEPCAGVYLYAAAALLSSLAGPAVRREAGSDRNCRSALR